jgi:hypothetical protein
MFRRLKNRCVLLTRSPAAWRVRADAEPARTPVAATRASYDITIWLIVWVQRVFRVCGTISPTSPREAEVGEELTAIHRADSTREAMWISKE